MGGRDQDSQISWKGNFWH